MQLPSTEDPWTGETVPDKFGHDVAHTAAHTVDENHWIAHVGGTTAELDALANESGVVSLDRVPITALNNRFSQNRDSPGWRRGFRVDDPEK